MQITDSNCNGKADYSDGENTKLKCGKTPDSTTI
jgi:hypothetical protein